MNRMLKAPIAALLLVLAGTTVYAQRCAGHMTYFLRNTKGELIDSEKLQLKPLRVGALGTYPVDETAVPSERTDWVKVLRFQTGCGQRLIEAELEYENQVMVIRFRHVPAEIDFFVDSLSFQEGTFEIDLKDDMALKDQKVNREGLKSKSAKTFLRDTARLGYLVAAENWMKVTAQ